MEIIIIAQGRAHAAKTQKFTLAFITFRKGLNILHFFICKPFYLYSKLKAFYAFSRSDDSINLNQARFMVPK